MRKRVLAMILSIVMILATLPKTAFAADETSGSCGDNVTWALAEDGTLTISGTGTMTDFRANAVPWTSSREQITSIIVQQGVTNIGDYAFYQCHNLASITILDSVTSIGFGAFWDCVNLAGIDIPDDVTDIGSHAFHVCSILTGIIIPNGTTKGNHPSDFSDIAFSLYDGTGGLDGITIRYPAGNATWSAHTASTDFAGATNVKWQPYSNSGVQTSLTYTTRNFSSDTEVTVDIISTNLSFDTASAVTPANYTVAQAGCCRQRRCKHCDLDDYETSGAVLREYPCPG